MNKTRTYTSVPLIAHCPSCHRQVQIPSFVKTANIGGAIKLSCGAQFHKNGKKCEGLVIIQPKKRENINTQEEKE